MGQLIDHLREEIREANAHGRTAIRCYMSPMAAAMITAEREYLQIRSGGLKPENGEFATIEGVKLFRHNLVADLTYYFTTDDCEINADRFESDPSGPSLR